MLDVMARRLAHAETRLETLAYGSVAARLARALLQLAEGGEPTFRVTHQTLGDTVGAYRETVTKTLDQFRSQGLVELGRDRVVLRDQAGLRVLAEE